MKTLVIGATGFIGTCLAKRLAQTDHELCWLVEKTANVGQLVEIGGTLLTGDITDKIAVLKGMKGCKWVQFFWRRAQRENALHYLMHA